MREVLQLVRNRLCVFLVEPPEISEEGPLAVLARPGCEVEIDELFGHDALVMYAVGHEVPHHARELVEAHPGLRSGLLQGLELGYGPRVEADAVHQHELPNPLRMMDRHQLGNPAADVMRHDIGAGHAEGIHEPDEDATLGTDGDVRADGLVGLAIVEEIRSHDATRLREPGHHLPPHEAIRRNPVDQDQRSARALLPKCNPVSLDVGMVSRDLYTHPAPPGNHECNLVMQSRGQRASVRTAWTRTQDPTAALGRAGPVLPAALWDVEGGADQSEDLASSPLPCRSLRSKVIVISAP